MKKLFSALCFLAIIGLAGCKEGPLPEDIENPVGGDTGYVAFRIKSADTGGMTRAWLDDNENDYAPGEDGGSHAQWEFANEDAIVDNLQANRMFFFRANGTYHSSSLLTLTEGGNHSANHGSSYPEKLYTATVKRTSDRGEQDWPTQCLVVLNGRPSALNALLLRAQADANFNLDAFLAYVNTDFGDGAAEGEGETLGLYKYKGDGETKDKYYFTMSNSVFFQGDSYSEDKLLNATQIPEGALQATAALASSNPVTVYVERIVAKVEVGFIKYDGATGSEPAYFSDENKGGFTYSFIDDAGAPSHEGDSMWLGSEDEKETPIKLKAVITGWTINGVEYQTKLFKDVNFSDVEPAVAYDWSADAPFEGWNDDNHHRSYWARDNHYIWNAAQYPTQYRKAFNGNATSYQIDADWAYGNATVEEGGNDIYNPTYPWALDYKPFDAESNPRKHKYCLENTFDIGEEANYKHMIMGSHLLIKGRLIMTGEENKALDEIADKYYYSDRYYDETTYINRQVAIITELLGENVTGENVVPATIMWDNDGDAGKTQYTYTAIKGGLWFKDGGVYKKVLTANDAENGAYAIKATDIFGIAPAYVLKGDGRVTIGLKGDDENGFGYREEGVSLYYSVDPVAVDETTGAPVGDPDFVQLTRNELVSLIYGITNVADCFKNGRMYYAVPIEHFIAKGAGNDYVAKYDGIETGDYGIVRNHWYRFTISNIVKPGIPVHDPEQPIIPNYDEEDRYLSLQVVIIPWHIVDNGNVSLTK